MVTSRVASGHLVRLHRGVYAVGHRQLRREGWWTAAVLAAGPHAALSHRDAAALHDLLPPGRHVRTEVTTTGRAAGTDRIRVYGTTVLDAGEVTTVRGIPVTTVARTLVDLADTVPKDRLAKAMNEAERLRVLDVEALARSLARTARRRGDGHGKLRRALAAVAENGAHFTRSHLEDQFLSLVVKPHDLPRPTMNATIDGMEFDAVWRDKRVVVELDGWNAHRTRRAFQEDRDRSNDLTTKGYAVLRFTYADVTKRPERTAHRVAEALRYPPPP